MKTYRLKKDIQLVDGVTIREGSIVQVKNVNTIPTPKDIFKNIEEERCPTCAAVFGCICFGPVHKCSDGAYHATKPTEKEECKHENVHTECANCGGKPQPKQLPSNEIEKDVEKFIKGGISPEYASYSAIVRFLDEHFKY